MSTQQKQDWKTKLPGCFGVEDKIFASHHYDEERAKTMMREAFSSDASIDEVLTAISDYLASQKARKEHIEEQLEKVRKFKFGA